MQRYSEILRFQEGIRSQHPAPEASITGPPSDTGAEAGEMFIVLVDLTPKLPHRSREIRTLAMDAYWNTSGSVVARLRRALAEANRHLVQANADAPPGDKCSGSISCLAFVEDELFLGQIGAAYVYLWHLNNALELFPRRNRLLIPLGGALPPVIHISYTQLAPGNTLLLATTWAAEAQARERWQHLLAHDSPEVIAQALDEVMLTNRTSGSFVLVQEGLASATPLETAPRRRPYRAPQLSPPLPVESSAPEIAQPSPESSPEVAYRPLPITEPEPARELPAFLARRASQPEPTPEVHTARAAWRWPPVKQWFHRVSTAWRAARGKDARAEYVQEQGRVRRALRALLPLPVENPSQLPPKLPPYERASVVGGLALGVLLLIAFITASMALQYGGSHRATLLLEQAAEARSIAYRSQRVEDWRRVLSLAEKASSLEGQNQAAQQLRAEAQLAIDALENAAVLKVYPLFDLGTAPAPRRLLVAQNWLYILNPAADEVVEVALNPDMLTALSEAPIPILRKGQIFNNAVVERLIDIAWISPGGTYPDGALLAYCDAGLVYIYEPALGPSNILPQTLQGNLHGSVTLMETFGQKIYLVQRQDQQILTYDPVNGVYDAARDYFPAALRLQLQQVLDVAIDGRVYLLMGDGNIATYFSGVEDPSFNIHDLPDANFRPTVLAMEPHPERGLIYLGDTERERIVVLDKRGQFRHQFRLPSEELRQLEALAVSESPHVLYLIAANRLYAAPIPDFVQ